MQIVAAENNLNIIYIGVNDNDKSIQLNANATAIGGSLNQSIYVWIAEFVSEICEMVLK